MVMHMPGVREHLCVRAHVLAACWLGYQLSPTVCDLHRSITPIPGQLYTVNPIAVNSPLVDVFTDNKRALVLIDSPAFGLVPFIAIGATLVGSIHFTVQPGAVVAKGGELGYFAFGGSTCITLISQGNLTLDADLQRMSTRCATPPAALYPGRARILRNPPANGVCQTARA